MTGVSISVLVAVASVFCVAAAAQTVSGFGFSLLAVPVLAVLVGAKTSVVGAALVGLALTAVMATRDRGHIDRRTVRVVILASLLGIPIGLVIITHTTDTTLRALIAVVVLVFTALLWRGLTLPRSRSIDAVAGFVSGTLATSTGTTGPPLVIAFHGKGLAPAVFRATLAATFLIQGSLALVGFTATGQVTRDALIVALVGLPGTAIGFAGGQRAFDRLDHDRFRLVVLGMLTLSGVLALASAILG